MVEGGREVVKKRMSMGSWSRRGGVDGGGVDGGGVDGGGVEKRESFNDEVVDRSEVFAKIFQSACCPLRW